MITALKSIRETDERLKRMEKHLHEIYSEVQESVSKRWQEFLAPIDAEIKKYDRAMNNPMDAEVREKAAKKRERLLKQRTILNSRFTAVSKKISDEISRTNEIALAYINGEVPAVFADNCNDISMLIKTETGDKFGVNVRFDLVDGDTVRLLAAENTDLFPELPPEKAINIPKDKRWNRQLIRSELLKGILAGEDIPSIAARIKNVVGMNEVSAVRNARTMVTSAQNSGRIEGMRRAQELGIIEEKEWMSSDQPGHTRDWHMPGAFVKLSVPIEQPFENEFGKIMYPGDPHAHPANVYNCRCTLGVRIVGFRDPATGKVRYI